jgi:hypothetical protein
MKTLFSLAVAVLFLTVFSPTTFAQQQPGSGPDDRRMMGREITPENFSEMRSHMLTMIEKRRTMLDTEKTCVEASKNADELKKCRPERPMGMGGGMRQNGPGRQQGSRGGTEGQQ